MSDACLLDYPAPVPRWRRTSRPVKPAIIDRDIPCVECGYNLRTLRRVDVCPECRTPVKRSLAGPLLRNAGTQWLMRVHRGLLLLHRASVIAAFAVILAPMLNIYLSVQLGKPGSALSAITIPLVMSTWSVLACAGLWLASSPTPRAEGQVALQSLLQRCVLLAIPFNTLAWIALGMATLSPMGRIFGNPLGVFGLSAPGPTLARTLLIALATLTWLHSMFLARWLNHIDARVEQRIRIQPTIIDRINQAMTRSHDNPPGASAEFWRGAAKWAPLGLAALIALGWYSQKSFPWWTFALVAFLPLMLLLTMRRTVRDVGEERALGEQLRERDRARNAHAGIP